jgi:hypothetical protein
MEWPQMISLCGEADIAECGRHRRVINATPPCVIEYNRDESGNPFILQTQSEILKLYQNNIVLLITQVT